ncbi:MAG: DUF349 domain-containing protein [Cyclobacteriaceae bacterium]|nr:DUF349 domain-containing protein [Cyclobacteriaceae bacterium]MCH8516382.1 DUF349 domain-containing protein [Cyclobacteriaceae bacterium]
MMSTEKHNDSELEKQNESTDASNSQEQHSEAEAASTEESKEEESEQEEAVEEEDLDYSNFSKKELLDQAESLLDQADLRKADEQMETLKTFFDVFTQEEEQKALKKFQAEGGEAADFEYYLPDEDRRFDEIRRQIRGRRIALKKELEKNKENNLKRKEEVLEKLRNLVDGEETTTSRDALKAIEEEWKGIGPTPGNAAAQLWANFNALRDRFYDNRSIYFELKDLDRKKNLEAKLELVARAEKLIAYENLKDAVVELNELHEEFKLIGPVPKDDQEPLWQRFKAASDQVYQKRKEHLDELRKELDENAEKKVAITEKLDEFLTFNSEMIKEWNEKTKELLAIQKEWDAIGGLPRNKAKEINRNFWKKFKQFFNNKNEFFKRLDALRLENLEQKEKLVEEAEAIKESTDWAESSKKMKELQQQWKEIGPVPEKKRNEVFKRFRKACDHFFNQMRSRNKEENEEHERNLKAKEAICDEIERMAEEKSSDVDRLEELYDNFSEVGFVPRRAMKSIQKRFNDAANKFLANAEGLTEDQQSSIKLMFEFSKLKSGPNAGSKMNHKSFALKKKISNLESDISTWKTNIEFFANSKSADKLKADFLTKVEKAENELEKLNEELRVIEELKNEKR